MTKEKIVILGSGSMGTAMAYLIGGNGFSVTVWGREKDAVEEINARHENRHSLPGVKLPVAVRATLDLKEALKGADLVVAALPAQVTGEVFKKAAPFISKRAFVLTVSKGIEVKTGRTVSKVINDILKQTIKKQIAVLMGPLFASEISTNIPTMGLVATPSKQLFNKIKKILSSPNFFVRYSDDVLGAELAGALKNIYAIMLGVADGLGYGWNTKSAALTYAVAEMAEIGYFLGGRKETFYGLAGLGDLLTTGFGEKSRNRRFGEKICQLKNTDEALKTVGQVVEGVETLKVIIKMLKPIKKKTPLIHVIYNLVNKKENPCALFKDIFEKSI